MSAISSIPEGGPTGVVVDAAGNAAHKSRWKSAKKKGPASTAAPKKMEPVARKPIQFFKEKHVLVEMNELRGHVWMETHRWNFGLEEDLADDGHLESAAPHLPWISAWGLTQLATSMEPDTIILDPPNVRTFTKLVDVVAKAVSAHIHEDVGNNVRDVLGYQIWDHHVEVVPEHEHESSEEHLEKAKFGYHADEEKAKKHDGHFERLIPDEAEESANILVGAVDWLHEDIVVVVRLKEAIRVREISNADPTGKDSFPPTKFFAVILGPPLHGASCIRHVEMGEALAALMQDEDVLKGFYGAETAMDVTDVINVKMHKLTIMPQILQPTKQAVKKKAEQLRDAHLKVARSRFPKDQVDKWSRRAAGGEAFSASGMMGMMVKYAMPLVFGVILALILKNTDAHWYDLALGPAHHGADAYGNDTTHDIHLDAHDTHETNDTTIAPNTVLCDDTDASHDAPHDIVPTVFGFALDGHEVNFYFIVNDILMCFFFGLATQEITESFSPGGMMHPIGRSVVNPLGATIGGVLGPVVMYFVLLMIFDGAGSFDNQEYTVDDLLLGWGIPTATDIAICWAVAVVVFGAGHPAVKYLLLLAIVDDGIGLIIIAVAYPDPAKPTQPQWLGLVVLAMIMSYAFRRWKWKEWWLWVLLAGPVSWYGLIRTGLHPALALCFVVPFMPGAPPEDKKKKAVGDNVHKPDHETDDHKSHSTLQNFEHAIKGFVDLIVLFAFGLASAGVDLSGFGPYTGVIVGALVLGKTLGITVMAMLMVKLGFPFPPGMNMKCAVMVGFIASIGLTVALFVAGEAYPTDPVIAGEAKLGALCSILVSVVAVIIGKFVDLSPDPIALDTSKGEAGANGEDGLDQKDSADDNEAIENVFAKSALSRLSHINAEIKKVEDETHVSRREAIGVFRKHANAIRDKVKIINALRGPVKGGPKVSGLAAPGGFLAAVKAQKAKEDAAEAAAASTKITPAGSESTPDDKALRKARRVSVKKDAADAAKIAAAAMQAAAAAAAAAAKVAEEEVHSESSSDDDEDYTPGLTDEAPVTLKGGEALTVESNL